jgi:hypothetical protein
MAQSSSHTRRPLLTKEQLKKKLEVSNFDPNAILRGAQLTVVGGNIALLPLYTHASANHYKSFEGIAESCIIHIGAL